MNQHIAEPRPHRTTIVVTALPELGHTEPAHRTAVLP